MQANFKSLCLCRKLKKRHCLRPGDTKLDRWVSTSTSIATTLGLPKGDKTPASTLALSPAQLLPWETTLIS